MEVIKEWQIDNNLNNLWNFINNELKLAQLLEEPWINSKINDIFKRYLIEKKTV